MRFIVGDLLDCPEADVIAHQCNCLTVRGHGLAAAVARKYPAADCYTRRRPVSARKNLAAADDRATPGTASILADGRVVALFGQWRPGRIGAPYFAAYPEYLALPETAEARAVWFKAALEDMIRQLPARTRPTLIGVPHLIGCDLAGGDWATYLQMLVEFEQAHKDRVEILVVRLPPIHQPSLKRARE